MNPSEELQADQQLLARYLAGREEGAFREIVTRYGGLVMGVTRKMLANEQDALDAYQATFLALAACANKVRPADGLPAWLHGTSVRCARSVRRQNARWESKRGSAASDERIAQPVEAVEEQERNVLLHGEIAKLPSRHRNAITLCDLAGLTRDEAAGRLGLPASTVSNHVAEGRALLKRRLVQRGVTAPVAALCAATAQAGVTPPTAAATELARAAVQFADGSRTEALGISPKAIQTAKSIMNGMKTTQLTTIFTLAVAAILLAGPLAAWFGFREAELMASPIPFGEAAPLGVNEPGFAIFSSTFTPDGLELFAMTLEPYLPSSEVSDYEFTTLRSSRPDPSSAFTAPAFFSSDFWHPDFSADGLAMYGMSRRGEIVVIRRQSVNEPFNAMNAELLVETPQSGTWSLWPTVSPNELEIIFARGDSESQTSRLYVTRRASKFEPFGPISLLPGPVNNADASSPDLSSDGLTLFFSGNERPGGYGTSDIWISTRETLDSPWSEPMNAGPAVNTAGVEWAPDVTADGRMLNFSRVPDSDDFPLYELWGVEIVPEPTAEAQACGFGAAGLVLLSCLRSRRL